MNRYLARQKTGVAGRRSEKRVSKKLGGRQVPGSGAARVKGDIAGRDMLVEAKSTSNESISLKLEWLRKIVTEAQLTGRTPAVSISFTTGNGDAVRDGDWVMVPRWVLDGVLS